MAKRGRPVEPLALEEDERLQLEAISRSRSMPHGLVRRARIILMTADGVPTTEIAKQCDASRPTISNWRKRFRDSGIAGLHDELKSGRPRSIDDERVAELITTVLESKPENATHWSTRSVAEATGVSKSQVHRYFQLFGLQPHRTKTFKLSNDPFFVEKVRDIVGLYLNPPEKALVLCVDEKSQVQALERTQPVLPMGLGYVEGITHDYVRHGTTTLFAALDAASGRVLAQCKKRHRHQEFLSFLRHIDENVPQELDVHLILDNYATHKHSRVRAWLSKRPRFHVHFTPTYSSWLNQVERWFGLITQQAIRRGSHRNVRELIKNIENYVARHNEYATPLVWTATAESILGKLERLCKVISGTEH